MAADTRPGGNTVQPPAFSKVASTKAVNISTITKPARPVDNTLNVRVAGEKKDYVA